MEVVEEHLVPAVLAAQHEGHDVVEQRPLPLRILRQEMVPRVRVGEVGDEHPRGREAAAREEGHGEHEAPALAERAAQRPGAQEPDARPEARDEERVLSSARQPLLPELLVALAPGTLVREVEVPLQREEGPGIIQANEVDERQQRAGEQEAEGVDGEGVLPVPPCPLQQPVLELLGIPPELALLQEVHGARVVAIVLEHELLPGQREEIAEGMRDVLLPVMWRERGSVHYIVINVDVLDSDVRERDAECNRARPPVIWKARQCGAVGQYHRTL
mmetsp:Transcript_2630/g.7044  ORF Transcript_2630/g.7044 Transcript_2630/m.7044 type:complete len:274 (+) Transcript_2630:655-1476(+)